MSRTHINNIVHFPSGEKFSVDVAFGGDGPISPLPMVETGDAIQNLGTQQVRLVHEMIPKQRLTSPLWVYQYRNSVDLPWNSFYSFAEIEFFQEDFEVMNWWASAKTLHRWTVLAVRFLREGENVNFGDGIEGSQDSEDIRVTGKFMLVNNVVKAYLDGKADGKTKVIHEFDTEVGRLEALRHYFGIELKDEEKMSIQGWDMALK